MVWANNVLRDDFIMGLGWRQVERLAFLTTGGPRGFDNQPKNALRPKTRRTQCLLFRKQHAHTHTQRMCCLASHSINVSDWLVSHLMPVAARREGRVDLWIQREAGDHIITAAHVWRHAGSLQLLHQPLIFHMIVLQPRHLLAISLWWVGSSYIFHTWHTSEGLELYCTFLT